MGHAGDEQVVFMLDEPGVYLLSLKLMKYLRCLKNVSPFPALLDAGGGGKC